MIDADELLELQRNTRAMRRLSPEPVADALVDRILRAGLCAPSGGNRQNWHFIVVRDAYIKKQIQRFYKRAFDEVVGPHYASSSPAPGSDASRHQRQHAAVEHLTDHFHEAPVWIVACLDLGEGAHTFASGASIYPAVQNMLLAARALGLGATLTTRHTLHGREVDVILQLPKGARSYAILPIGHPLGEFGPVTRATEGMISTDIWGAPRNLDFNGA